MPRANHFLIGLFVASPAALIVWSAVARRIRSSPVVIRALAIRTIAFVVAIAMAIAAFRPIGAEAE